MVYRGNIKPNKPKKLLRCHYHPETNPYCPVFSLGFIAAQAREKFSELCLTVCIRSVVKQHTNSFSAFLRNSNLSICKFNVCVNVSRAE